MGIFEGNLIKMKSTQGTPVHYTLTDGQQAVDMNGLIGKRVHIQFLNKIHCIGCGAETKKSFAQGYCYTCFLTHPGTSPCILKPELCRAHEGESRDMNWSQDHCLVNHYVYLALSGTVKVGVTRHTQVPVRWIDQGASAATIVAETPNRFIAGTIEVFLKAHFTDKTNWRKMLKNEIGEESLLLTAKHTTRELLQESFPDYLYNDSEMTYLEFPVHKYPQKVTSISLDKIPDFSAVLTGIKGQYLLFEDGLVFNVRKHNGYAVSIKSD